MNSRVPITVPGWTGISQQIAIILLAIFAFGLLTAANYHFARQNPGGNDFIPRWLGARLFITEGLSPYSETTSLRIQQILHGRPAVGQEDHALFVYPFYTILIMLPYALIGELPLARAFWMASLEVALVLIAFFSLRMVAWRPGPLLLAAIVIFATFWYHGARPVINGNPAVFVSLLIAAGLLAIWAERDVTAGFLLALSSIKLQMVLLFLPFVVIWAFSRRRWPLTLALPGWFVLLLAASALFLPNWAVQNLAQVRAYTSYTQPGTPGGIFDFWWPGLGQIVGYSLSLGLALLLLREWRAAWGKRFIVFLWTASLTLVITSLIGVRTATENYAAFLPGLILIWVLWERQWGTYGRYLVVATLLLLLVGLWALFLSSIEGQSGQHLIMFLPLPVFMLLALYSVRGSAHET
jgi:hypothetical protein